MSAELAKKRCHVHCPDRLMHIKVQSLRAYGVAETHKPADRATAFHLSRVQRIDDISADAMRHDS
ncbi:MAG: hypothetical protein JZU55_15475, partial [Afipia sp.]|nr:hypothetical protein [Afipia sp.]